MALKSRRLSDARFYVLVVAGLLVISGLASLWWPLSALAMLTPRIADLFLVSIGAAISQALTRSNEHFKNLETNRKGGK